MNRFPYHFLPAMIMLLATFICIGIYWEGLYGPLLLDDISNLGKILAPEFNLSHALNNLLSDSGLLQRPISMLSFIINGLLDKDIFYWKLTNLALHLCSGILLYLLSSKLLRITNSGSHLAAAIITAAWLLHPLQVSTVLYVVQRMTELSALCIIAAMLTYTIARERQQKGVTAWPLQLITWIVLFPLGLLSKENALLFPAFVLLMEVFIFNRQYFNKKKLLLLTLFLSIISIVAMIAIGNWILSGYETRSFTLQERLYTQALIVITYLGMLLIPAQKRMGFVHDDFPLSYGLLDPWTTLLAIFVITSMIIAAFLLRKKHPLIGFGILFFFLGHLMESTIIPLELMFEHRNYLPSFGIFLATVITLNIIIKNRIILFSFTTLAFSLLIFTTLVRANTWSSTETLYYYMEMVHPRSERLAHIKATQFTDIQQYDLARKRLAGFHSLGAKLQNLSIDCLENHTLNDQQLNIDLNRFNQASNYSTLQMIDLANLGLNKKCNFSSIKFIALIDNINHLTTQSNHNRILLLMYKSHYLWQSNKQKEALNTLNSTFLLNKKNPTPLFLSCEWMLDTNRWEAAESTCKKALNIAKSATFNKYDKLANTVQNRLHKLDK